MESHNLKCEYTESLSKEGRFYYDNDKGRNVQEIKRKKGSMYAKREN